MPRTCLICQHPLRKEIEKACAGGTSNRSIARQFAVSDDSVQRHKAHIRQALDKAVEKREIELAVSIAARINQAYAYLERALGATADKKTIIQGVNAMVNVINVEGRLTGAFQQEKPNAEETARQEEQFERGVQTTIAECAAQGIKINHEDATRLLRRQMQKVESTSAH